MRTSVLRTGAVVGVVAVAALFDPVAASAQEKPAAPQQDPPKKDPPTEEPPPPPVPSRPKEEGPPPPVRPRDPSADAPPPAVDPTSPDFLGLVLGDLFETTIVGDERMLAATGTMSQPIWIKLPGFEVRCEHLVAWGDRDKLMEAIQRRKETLTGKNPDQILGPLVHAVYAEGAVHAKINQQTIRADRLFIDFVRGKAYFVRARMTSTMESKSARGAIPLTVRAEVIRAETRNKYKAERAQLTTCSYADPHYELVTDEIEVDYSHGAASFETAWWPTVRMDTVAGKDTPIFAFPKLGGTTGITSTPIQTVKLGRSSRDGATIATIWGGDLRRGDGEKWGEWRLHVDERTRRGPAVGVDVDHKGPASAGPRRDELEFSSLWQRDRRSRDEFSDRAFDGGNDPDTNSRNRGFAHLFHRWFVESPSLTSAIGKDWRVDTEVSYYSDRGYLPEDYSRLTQTEKQQETFVQARKTWGNQGVSLFSSYRLNDEAAALDRRPGDLLRTDYENQTQYLPSATYHLINQPVLSTSLFPVNVSVQASAANVKRRYDDLLAERIAAGTGWRGEYVRRGDVETRVTTPFSLGDVHVNPAFGGSIYAVDDANGFSRMDDGYEGRWSAFWDLRAGTQATKTWSDAKSSALDLDGLRHVVSLDAQVFERFEVSDEPSKFQANDPIDELSEVGFASIRLRNRLQTKRDGEVIDWLDYETRFLHFFRRESDTMLGPFGFREDFAQPLQRLDFPGEEKYSAVKRDGSAFWQHRARFEALRGLWLVGEADYDMNRNAMETSAVGLRWFADKQASFYVGRRTIHSDSAIWTERMDYRLSNRWGVAVQLQQDTKSRTRRGLNTSVSLYRRAHDFTIALELEVDEQADHRGVSFAVYPNDWVGDRQDPFSLRRPLDYDALKWYR